MQAMPFGSKGEFKSWIKDYVRNVRQTLKGNGVAQEEIKKCVLPWLAVSAPAFLHPVITLPS